MRSALYAANTSNTTIADGGIISPGTVYRRFGQNIMLSGDAVRVCGTGYYEVKISSTLAPSAAGTVTVTLFNDGIAIPGAVASETVAAADDNVNLSIVCLIRENCPCCDDASNLTLVLTGVESDNVNTAIVVEKL